MDFSNTVNAVAVAIQARVAVLLIGAPGDAKTRIVDAIMRQVCADHETSIVSLHEPPDYGGYPVPKEDGVALLPTRWAKRLAQVEAPKLAGLFLDELSDGAPATRSAAMRGILDGTWGEQHIPQLATAAAMNPPDIAEAGYELSAPLSNRFVHIDWDMPADYWVDAMIGGFKDPVVPRVPHNWTDHRAWAKALVASFGHVRPAALKQLPKEASMRARAWPSYRTWTMSVDLLAACRAVGYDLEHDVTVTLIGGAVGPGAAREFIIYSKEMDLPDPESVLKDPSSLVLPQRGDRAFAVLTAVASAVIAKNTPERWNAGWDVLAVAAEAGRPDVAAVAARALAKNRPESSKPIRPPKALNAFIPILKEAGLL